MYGIFVPLLIAAWYVQWDKYSKGRGVNPVMVFTTVFFGVTTTTHCALSVYRAIRAISYTPQGETANEYLDPPYPVVELFRLGLFQFQIVVADVIMAHRMYHIYSKNPLVCIVPSITITGLFVIGCGMTNQLRDLTSLRSVKLLGDWTSACFCVTIFNSLFMSIAISLKLWSVHRETRRANLRMKDSVVLRAMKVLTESAALWTTCVTINFLTFLTGSNLASSFLAMTGPAAGISFCLIIVRLGMTLPSQSREESWDISIHTPDTQTPGTNPLHLSFSRDVFTRDSKDSRLGEESSRRGRGDQFGYPPKSVRASLSLPAPTMRGVYAL